MITVGKLQNRDGNTIFADKVKRKGRDIAVVLVAIVLKLYNQFLTLNCSKFDSSSSTKVELLWKLAIFVSYFLHMRLRSFPITFEALGMAPSLFLPNWLISDTSNALD